MSVEPDAKRVRVNRGPRRPKPRYPNGVVLVYNSEEWLWSAFFRPAPVPSDVADMLDMLREMHSQARVDIPILLGLSMSTEKFKEAEDKYEKAKDEWDHPISWEQVLELRADRKSWKFVSDRREINELMKNRDVIIGSQFVWDE